MFFYNRYSLPRLRLLLEPEYNSGDEPAPNTGTHVAQQQGKTMLDTKFSNLKLDTRANKNLKLDSRANKARKQSKPAPDTGTNLAQQQGMKLDTRANKI
jgi:hypothetical protein